ncbi:MAG: T9SS type A sorting domain-containing protein [bacterium]|nr:MAG: T9SS type A sorting domain-containing protein [bacterium]
MTFNYMNSLLGRVMLVVFLLLSAQMSFAFANNWDFYYSGDVVPNEDPSHPWTLIENFNNDEGVATASDGIFQLDTSTEQAIWNYIYNWDPNNSNGWTFETSLKTESDFSEPIRIASEIYFSDEAKDFRIYFFKDRTQFNIGGGTIHERYPVNNTYLRTYRICLQGPDLKVYLDGLLLFQGEVVRNDTPEDYISFGDFHGNYGAVSHWDYIAWEYEYNLPAIITLAEFTTFVYDNYLIVNWMTASEINNAGFNLHRALSVDGKKIQINNGLIPTQGNEFRGASYSYIDTDVADGVTYYYWLESVDLDGSTTLNGPVISSFATEGETTTPVAFMLAQNYPNPFNPITVIRYDLSVDCHVRLEVYNIRGQRVATLVDEYQNNGTKIASWNGKNENNAVVSSGVYFYKLQAGTFTRIKKMVLLR